MTDKDDLYDRILSEGPSSGTLFLVLSRMKEEGHLRRVIQECIRALSVHPMDLPIRHLLAEAYFQEGLFSQAESELKKVTDGIHGFATSYKLQADLYRRQGRVKEAAEALHVYLAHRPDDEEAFETLQGLIPGEKAPPPVPTPPPEEVPSAVPEPGEGFVEPGEAEGLATPTLAEVYFNQGLLHESIAVYEKVVSQDPAAERPRQRLLELRAMLEPEPAPAPREKVDREKEKKKRMITILESWLTHMQQMSRPPVAP